jgi:hypothetical protein
VGRDELGELRLVGKCVERHAPDRGRRRADDVLVDAARPHRTPAASRALVYERLDVANARKARGLA